MFKSIGKLFRGNKLEDNSFFEPEDHAKFATPAPKHNIRSTLFKKKHDEEITVKFFVDISCYDTARETIFRQTIKAGTYRFAKTVFDAGTAHQAIWYLFRGETRGMTEATLNDMIAEGQAQITNN